MTQLLSEGRLPRYVWREVYLENRVRTRSGKRERGRTGVEAKASGAEHGHPAVLGRESKERPQAGGSEGEGRNGR